METNILKINIVKETNLASNQLSHSVSEGLTQTEAEDR